MVPPVAPRTGSEDAARIRALEAELAATRAELQQLQDLLAELPGIFERKFQQRLDPVLQQQHQLQNENSGLRSQLRQLPAAAGMASPTAASMAAPVIPAWPQSAVPSSEQRREPGLLMPSVPQRGPIRIARPRSSSEPKS